MNFLRFFQSSQPQVLLGGRYKLLKQMGAGGFGQTFIAEDWHLPGHPRCVIKQLKPQFSSTKGLQTAKRLFDTEAKVLYQLGNHDQIPRLLAHFEQDEEFYLAQELIIGNPLSQELLTGQQWVEGQVITLLRSILDVLCFVHQQGVIHRDIKPSNLIHRHQDGKIVLIDFGAVKQASVQLADPNSGPTRTISIGTQGYMPNEQIAGNPRFSSDVYAAGKIGIQALTGIAPRALKEDPQTGEIQWRYLAPLVSPELADVLDQMVRYDFRARYPSASEALKALEQLDIPLLPLMINQTMASLQLDEESDIIAATSPWQPDAPTAEPIGKLDTLSEVSASEVSASEVGTAGWTQASVHLPSANLPSANSPSAHLPPAHLPPASLPPVSPETSQAPTEAMIPALKLQTAAARTSPDRSMHRSKMQQLVLPGVGLAAIALLVGLSQLFQGELWSSSDAAPDVAPSDVASTSSPTPVASASPSPDPQAQAVQLKQEADQLREAENFQQALTVYDQVLQIKADSAEAQWGKCYSLNRLNRPTEAIAACDAALQLNAAYPEALWSKGYALDQQQQYQEALSLYEQAIVLKPDFADAWSNKGTALLRLNRPEEALSALDRATQLNPNLAEAWNSRGVALWAVRRFDEAVASVDRALQIQPDYADAQNLRAEMRQRLGR
ncbi:MAG: hypothetical protein Kow00121_26740 [Elainellaceae cyanobacterium]